MTKLLLLLKKIYVAVIFIALEVAAINYYSGSTSYTNAKIYSATNAIFGGAYGQFAKVRGYFGLRKENNMLAEQLAAAKNELERYRELFPAADTTQLVGETNLSKYFYMPATIVRNTINRPENYITLDRGSKDGVTEDMAVVTPEGMIVGYTIKVDTNYSIAMSVLNTEFHTGGKIKDTDYFGSVVWDGGGPHYVSLMNMDKYAEIVLGDTIITTVYSSRFPEGVVIGTIEDFEMVQSTYYNVTVRLATNFGSLNKVFLVRYNDMEERRALEMEYRQD